MKVIIPCQNARLLEQAFTHKSFFVENRLLCNGDNEKLEFLGDAVLDLAVSELLYQKFPSETEGDLSQRRSSLVNEGVLAGIASELEIGAHLKLGRGEAATGGSQKPRILASTFEAIVGAIFLSSGYNSAADFIRPLFEAKLESIAQGELNPEDFKTRFQEWAQRNFKTTPTYEVVSESGLDHEKTFTVVVKVLGEVKGEGLGKNKKNAEQAAARVAFGGIKNV